MSVSRSAGVSRTREVPALLSDRVSIFLPSLRGGGAERVSVLLANEMVARHLPTDLIVASAVGAYRDLLDPRVRLVDLGRSRVSRCLFPLIRYLRQERPAAFMSVLVHANVVASAAHCLSRSQSRFVVSVHSHLGAMPRSPKAGLLWYLAVLAYRRADAVVAVSDGVARDTRRLSGRVARLTRVIHNPIVDQRVIRLSQEPVDHPALSHGVPVFLGVGRLVEAKDYDPSACVLACGRPNGLPLGHSRGGSGARQAGAHDRRA